MMRVKIIILGIVILAAVAATFYAPKFIFRNEPDVNDITVSDVHSFEDCVMAGFPVMESYPRQCRSAAGELFVEDIGNELEKTDLIRVRNPRPNQAITSPLTVTGEARGNWFFEASFPIALLDGDGNQIILNPGYIMTASEWMTRDFVPFEGTIEFDMPRTKKGTLILSKDNPSGLPEHDDQLVIPIVFQ